MPFSPVALADIDLGRRPIRGIEAPALHARMLAIVRLDGCPVGSVQVPMTDGRCSAAEIAREIDHRLSDRLVRRAVAQRMLSQRPRAQAAPSLTVAVCTRNRPVDLAGCLRSLDAAVGRSDVLDVLVVDNAPSDDATARLVTEYPGFRYVVEPRPGLSWARRKAIDSSTSDVVAFIDDDVQVDVDWTRRIGETFAADPSIQAVLGLVVPLELEFEAQWRFERHGGFGRGFDRRWFRSGGRLLPGLANTGTMGTGANMAFRREVFEQIGTFDVALGAGSPAEGGEDLEMVFRVLASGGTVVYAPCVMVRHRHRRDREGLVDQIRSWGRGMFAHLTAAWLKWPEHRWAISMLGLQLLGIYYPRRMLQAPFDSDIEWRLAWAELCGALSGPVRYVRGRARAGVVADRPMGRVAASGEKRGATVAIVDLSVPAPDVVACPGDMLEIHVVDQRRDVGVVSIAAKGGRVSGLEVVDAIVTRLDVRLLDPSGQVRGEIERLLHASLDPVRDGE